MGHGNVQTPIEMEKETETEAEEEKNQLQNTSMGDRRTTRTRRMGTTTFQEPL